ncbi:MAG: hypothetical protein KGI03_01085 [Patescibacteria group bacterium]|nr:hypothetical protein [Patescibacteria group bacterium]
MTATPITSAQEERLEDLVTAAVRRARKEADPDKDGLQRLIARGGEFQDYLVAGIRRFTAKLPDYTVARSILGGDFIAPEEIAIARPGIIYTAEQIEALAQTMPSEDELRWCKEYGYAVLAAPSSDLSLLDVRSLENGLFYRKTGGWYADQAFAAGDKTLTGWLAIRKTPVPSSTSKTWDGQTALLAEAERVPNAAEMSWFITTFYKVRGVRLFERVYVRTSSRDSDGHRVYVGFFDAGGLFVDYYFWDDLRLDYLGLSSARKS